MNIGERLGKSLPRAGISPRNLAAITKVHFTTIYSLMRTKGKTYPVVECTLSEALDKIDKLYDDGNLPFTGSISGKEKTDRLVSLLATNN